MYIYKGGGENEIVTDTEYHVGTRYVLKPYREEIQIT